MNFRIQIKEVPKRRATNVLKEQQGITVLKDGKWYCNVNDELIEIDKNSIDNKGVKTVYRQINNRWHKIIRNDYQFIPNNDMYSLFKDNTNVEGNIITKNNKKYFVYKKVI